MHDGKCVAGVVPIAQTGRGQLGLVIHVEPSVRQRGVTGRGNLHLLGRRQGDGDRDQGSVDDLAIPPRLEPLDDALGVRLEFHAPSVESAGFRDKPRRLH
jgi:hypothetical protein